MITRPRWDDIFLFSGYGMFVLCIVAASWGWLRPAYRYIDHHANVRLALVAGCAVAGLLLTIIGYGERADQAIEKSERKSKSDNIGYPKRVQNVARRSKAALQMLVGLYALGWLAWSFYLSHRIHNCVPDSAKMAEHLGIHEHFCYFVPPSVVAFGVVADALAAATVIQLAYTLFTPGPDEALDPALLALAAAFLLAVGQITSFKWQDGLAIVLYAVGFGLLFAVRVFLAPDEDSPPTLWWWRRRPSFWPKPARPR